MKYLAVAITLAACFELGRGLSCYVCEEEGHAVICSDNGDNEIEKECGDHIIGCVEEVVLVKNTSESRTIGRRTMLKQCYTGFAFRPVARFCQM